MLYNIISSLMCHIQSTLSVRDKLSTIRCSVRTPRSDSFGHEVFKEFVRLNPKTYDLYAGYDNEDGTGSCILYLSTILFQGNYTDLKHLAKSQGYDSISDFCKNADPSTMQLSIDNRLAESKEIQKRVVPEKIKKKDKKRKKKH